MRAFFFISVMLGICATAFPQNCNFYYLQNNKTAEVSIYNKKGNESGKNVYKVSSVSKSGKDVSAIVNSEMFDKNGKSISTAVNNIKCSSGVLMMDMKMFISPDQQERMKGEAKASDVYLSYPTDMKTGDALPDGIFEMDMKQSSGINSTISIKLTERKVESKESITTPAGTWECFKITYHSVIRFSLAGIGIPIKMDVTEWFAPGFGVVKTESKYGSTLLTKFQ